MKKQTEREKLKSHLRENNIMDDSILHDYDRVCGFCQQTTIPAAAFFRGEPVGVREEWALALEDECPEMDPVKVEMDHALCSLNTLAIAEICRSKKVPENDDFWRVLRHPLSIGILLTYPNVFSFFPRRWGAETSLIDFIVDNRKLFFFEKH